MLPMVLCLNTRIKDAGTSQSSRATIFFLLYLPQCTARVTTQITDRDLIRYRYSLDGAFPMPTVDRDSNI